jgi:hypothetical protein
MAFRTWFDRIFGVVSVLIGLLLIFPVVGFFIHLSANLHFSQRIPWLPYLIVGMAVVGVIQVAGGFSRLRWAGRWG